jgi:hypothetical protein
LEVLLNASDIQTECKKRGENMKNKLVMTKCLVVVVGLLSLSNVSAIGVAQGNLASVQVYDGSGEEPDLILVDINLHELYYENRRGTQIGTAFNFINSVGDCPGQPLGLLSDVKTAALDISNLQSDPAVKAQMALLLGAELLKQPVEITLGACIEANGQRYGLIKILKRP